MIPELGQIALSLALALALFPSVVSLYGAHKADARLMGFARPAARLQFACVALAFGCLVWSFVANDFSVRNVATNSNSLLPLHYRVAASWGSHEGSLLLWVLMLAGWTLAVTFLSRRLPPEMAARVLGVMGLVSSGFLAFLLFTSNPFRRLVPAAAEGRDLNPLLQDPGMVLHPPMLYMGYVGFSVAFAFAVAALLGGRLDTAWARWSRPWTTAAWCFLTIGIALGSWWAYNELGWGGWWFWDPVENASFMPWLAGTALIHSLAVTEKRGVFRGWTVLLAISAFALSLLGAFLVRSGVLTSVHTFATDPKRGLFLLALFVLVVGSALVLYALRAPRVGAGGEGRFAPVSRESALLANNLLLVAATGVVLLGTLYPLALDALGQGKVSVGPPYFDAVFAPIMAPLVFLMAVGPLARWKSASLPELATRLRWALGISLVLALLLPFTFGSWKPVAGFGLFLALWVLLSLFSNLKSKTRAHYGMVLAHAGVAVFVAGVTLVNSYETERHVPMAIGETVALGGYDFRFEGARAVDGPNYIGMRGRVEVTREGRRVAMLFPEKRTYLSQQMPMTEAAIDTGLRGDIYVALDEPLARGAWSLRLYSKPFVTWIWGGCLLMALGGALALSDRRYRSRVPAAQPADAANLAVLRQQLAELEADLRAGTLSQAQYLEAKLEIERRAIGESGVADGNPTTGTVGRRWTIGAGFALPVVALVVYLQVGAPASLLPAPRAPAEGPVSREQIEAMVARLAARLEKEPGDAKGWAVLGLSYYTLQRYPEAAAAYARLAALAPDNAQILADQAEALAMAQGRRMGGKPIELARRALELDPKQWKALALVASDAFARQDYRTAISYWERLRAAAPKGSPMAESVGGYIEEARRLAAGGAAAPMSKSMQ